MTDYREIQIQELEKKIAETQELLQDPTLSDLATQEIQELETQKQTILDTMQGEDTSLADSFDNRNIILEVKGAAGGDEAKIWADELIRMYTRFGQERRFKVEMLDESVIKISGHNASGMGAFGAFKYEAGVHRVQRTPKTEKRGRIHTSTATVSILPELEDLDLHINPEDIAFEAFRSGGHGGQNVNKVSTAVRLKHIPSGITVVSQAERSQIQNREIAMKIIRAKIWEIEIEKQRDQIASLRSTQVGRGMRSEKIKTYNFPQDRLTDHRMGKSWKNLPLIMDGSIPEEHPTEDSIPDTEVLDEDE
jgi:peptide chain release factor 1